MTTIKKLFDIAIQKWLKNDLREKTILVNYLSKINDEYKKLEDSEKKYFDKILLSNPYPDSRIYYWDENKKIQKVIVWIDIEWPEILLVNEYNKKNKNNPIDLIIWHHPESKALLDLEKVMSSILPHNDFKFWVPINQAEKINEPRVGKVSRSLSPTNYNRVIPFASMLDIAFMWFHTPADNMCYTYMSNLIDKNMSKINSLQDIIKLLEEIPEMQISKKNGMWPKIWNWSKESKPWKIIAAWITWWTSWSIDIYKKYADAWVWTLLMMHIWEDHLEEAKKHNLNIIMTDHMASDSLWMNLILDEYEKLWIEILDFSWFIRVSRV